MSFLRLAIIMAGGSGERFWPLSHAKRPKQLLKLTHPEQTLLEEAVHRISPLIRGENVYIATTRLLEEAIRAEGGVLAGNVFAEPEKRNTLGCLCWVSANLLARFPDQPLTLAVLTADHKIGNPDLFRSTVETALSTAERTGALVTIGIEPTRPETGYGYIQMAEADGEELTRRARAFHEKPTLPKAEEYLAEGDYLWNSGMFFWTLSSFLRELDGAQTETYRLVLAMADALQKGKPEEAETLFASLPSQSVDYAVMERAKSVYVVAGTFPWDDVGSWDALERSFDRDGNGNVVQGNVAALDSSGCVLVNESHLKVGVLGVEDLVVVVSKDGVLVCHKGRSQEVKRLAAEFERP